MNRISSERFIGLVLKSLFYNGFFRLAMYSSPYFHVLFLCPYEDYINMGTIECARLLQL